MAGNNNGQRSSPNNRYTAANLSISEIFQAIREQVSLLIRKEIDLAKTELKADLKAEAVMVSGLVFAAICGFLAVSMLFVTAILALSLVLPGWASGLIVSGFLLLVGLISALIGWKMRVKSAFVRTKEVLRGDVTMTKEGFA